MLYVCCTICGATAELDTAEIEQDDEFFKVPLEHKLGCYLVKRLQYN